MLVGIVGVLVGTSATAFYINAASVLAYALALLLCWLRFGRDVLPLSSISSVCAYIGSKLPLYRRIFSRSRPPQWVRTDREGDTK
jgi:hypothetical protein